MTGNVVEVCSDTGCVSCGTMGQVGDGQWGTVTCGQAIQGHIVKVTAPSTILQIAQIEVYGIGEMESLKLPSYYILWYQKERHKDNSYQATIR